MLSLWCLLSCLYTEPFGLLLPIFDFLLTLLIFHCLILDSSFFPSSYSFLCSLFLQLLLLQSIILFAVFILLICCFLSSAAIVLDLPVSLFPYYSNLILSLFLCLLSVLPLLLLPHPFPIYCFCYYFVCFLSFCCCFCSCSVRSPSASSSSSSFPSSGPGPPLWRVILISATFRAVN